MEIDPHPGDRPFESWTFRVIWGFYLALMSLSLMSAADIRAGNFDGFSFILPGVMLLFGILSASLTPLIKRSIESIRSLWKNALLSIGLALANALVFVALVFILYYIVPELQVSNKWGPFLKATLIYWIVIAVVFLRLQRRISPSPNDYGHDTELFQIHFNNSWRMSQVFLSLSVIVGFIVSIGLFVVQQQETIIEPLAWFIGGVLFSVLPLMSQFWYEMRFLEKAYER